MKGSSQKPVPRLNRVERIVSERTIPRSPPTCQLGDSTLLINQIRIPYLLEIVAFDTLREGRYHICLSEYDRSVL